LKSAIQSGKAFLCNIAPEKGAPTIQIVLFCWGMRIVINISDEINEKVVYDFTGNLLI